MPFDDSLESVDLKSEVVGSLVRSGTTYSKQLPTASEVYVVDFFAGAGGMTSGFHSVRQSGLKFKGLGAVDINETALETLHQNTGVPTFTEDIRNIASAPETLERLMPLLTGRSPENPLVFIGCPPCQGFSAHRKKDPRNDPRNDLIGQFIEICLFYMPEVVVMENVPEMVKGKYEYYYRQARAKLEEKGYHISESIVDMSRYGVPQRRKRAIVVATLNGPIDMPAPPLRADEVRTVRESIGHLSSLSAGETDERDPWHRAPRHTKRILDRIGLIPHDGGDMRDLPEDAQLACHSEMKQQNRQGFSDVYGRLRWDEPSVTITAKSSTPSCGRFLHPEQDRNISVREAAILQGFPQNYIFSGPFVSQYRQVGEAVPPLFARYLAATVLNYFRPMPAAVKIVVSNIENAVEHKQKLNKSKIANSVDLFCGAGGLSLGLKGAGYDSVLACDLNEAAVETYSSNVGPAQVLDLAQADVVEIMNARVGAEPYVVVGGPPCQGFSQQRRGADEDPRNKMVRRHAEIALALDNKPRAIVLENVAYLDSPRGKHALQTYLDMMKDHGYDVFRYDTNSANFGVPQMRLRLVLIAIKKEFNEKFQGLQPISSNRWVTLGEAFDGLSTVPTNEPNHVVSRESTLNRQRMAYVDMGRGRTAIPDDLQLACHRNYDGHLDVFGRLDWFGQARTLTGGFDSASRGEYVHPFRNRSITAREAARLQGFPDSFEFKGNRSEVRQQIGNAVPPLLGYAIGESLKGIFEVK